MAAAPTRWTDERLDDQAGRLGRFEANVDRRFDKVDERFDRVDERFDRFETDVDRRCERVDQRFDRVEGRIDSLHRSIYGTTAAILAVLIAQILFG
jgi:archaellum component FlaC